ncbi:hypothetical protein, partial [Streptomyces sp. MnatMP-M17]|uniref:hypothetical protein n=1 Tax=Streptomyces sp. MnatMP-M17 TaxID=1839780 RepID=UPI0035218C5F
MDRTYAYEEGDALELTGRPGWAGQGARAPTAQAPHSASAARHKHRSAQASPAARPVRAGQSVRPGGPAGP